MPGSHYDEENIDAKIAYHREMEHTATMAGDFTKAEHHRNMQEIYRKIKAHLSKAPAGTEDKNTDTDTFFVDND